MLLILTLEIFFCGAPCRFQEHALCWHWSRSEASILLQLIQFLGCAEVLQMLLGSQLPVPHPHVPCAKLDVPEYPVVGCFFSLSSPFITMLPPPYRGRQSSHSSLLSPVHGSEVCKPPGTNLRYDLEFPLLKKNPRRAKKRNFSKKDCKKDWSVKPYLAKQKKSHRTLCLYCPPICLSVCLSICLSSVYRWSITICKIEFRGDKAIVWLSITVFMRNKAWTEVIFWKVVSVIWRTWGGLLVSLSAACIFL